jgi:para-nitrobenzyl esterase
MVKGASVAELENLSRLFQGAIAAFATHGAPNAAGLARWPIHDARGSALYFDRRIEAFAQIR